MQTYEFQDGVEDGSMEDWRKRGLKLVRDRARPFRHARGCIELDIPLWSGACTSLRLILRLNMIWVRELYVTVYIISVTGGT
jgi:hypothetical protein